MNVFDQYDAMLTARELDLVAQARRFCVSGFSEAALISHSKGEPLPREWTQKWAELGMLGLQAKRSDGGMEASYICKIRVAQEMAKHSFAGAFCVNHHQGQVTRLSLAGSERQRHERLTSMLDGSRLCTIAMTEPSGGSDVAGMASIATPVDGGWLLNGAKSWLTNGMRVTDLYLLAHVGEPKGVNSIASFLVSIADAPSVKRIEIPVPGAPSFQFAEIHFTDHFIPGWAIFNPPGEAVKASMGSVNAARVHVAAMAVASLAASLSIAVEYSETRRAFGKALGAHQGLRFELAEVATRFEAANALVFRAAEAIQRGEAAMTLAAAAKKFAVDTSIWGIDQCIRIIGATGASSAHKLSMLFSEVRMSAYGDGTNEMLLDRIGRNLTAEYVSQLVEL